MQYKTLLNKKISHLCLGSMSFGTQNTESESWEQLSYATDNGINYIDTAELYPVPAIDSETLHHTETYIGNWLQQSSIHQDTLTIVSKVMGPVSDRSQHARPQQNPLSRDTINTAIEGTLKRLQIECLDVYLVHWPLRKTNFFGTLGYTPTPNDCDVESQILETIQTMDTLIKQGKIASYGLSNETAWGIMKYVQLAEKNGLAKPITVQNPYNLLNRSYEVGGAEVSWQENIGLMSYSTLANGLLSGKHINGIQPDTRLALWPEYFSRYNTPQAEKAIKAYVDLAYDMGISPTALSIAFVLQQEFVDCVIVGATKTAQIDAWIEASDITLGTNVLQTVEQIHAQYTYPCP